MKPRWCCHTGWCYGWWWRWFFLQWCQLSMPSTGEAVSYLQWASNHQQPLLPPPYNNSHYVIAIRTMLAFTTLLSSRAVLTEAVGERGNGGMGRMGRGGVVPAASSSRHRFCQSNHLLCLQVKTVELTFKETPRHAIWCGEL